MPTLLVAALSARMLAEAAVRDGYRVIALDGFGDADTRAACAAWSPLAEPGSLRIDEGRLLSALRAAVRHGDVIGWVPGSGFEGQPDLLEQGARLLPLIGNDADTVRRVRDPQTFFGLLGRCGVSHPEVRAMPPAANDASGWLRKDARGTGGWHIRRWTGSGAMPRDPHVYFQREAPGSPMSATFIASGASVCVLGINALTVRRVGVRPHVFCGAIGPMPVSASVVSQIDRALRTLVPALGLRGLGSLDFLLDGDTVSVLEINPRPAASMALYEGCRFAGVPSATQKTHGLMQAHLRACLHGEWPTLLAKGDETLIHGIEVVYARCAMTITAAMTELLAESPGTHDQPVAATRLTRGDPLCSLSAVGITAHDVQSRLSDARDALLYTLETCP